MGILTVLADNFLENEIKKMNNEKETKMVGEKEKIRDRINRLCEENIWL